MPLKGTNSIKCGIRTHVMQFWTNSIFIFTDIVNLTWKVLVLASISLLCSLWRSMSASAPVTSAARSSVQINDFMQLTYKNNNVDISAKKVCHRHIDMTEKYNLKSFQESKLDLKLTNLSIRPFQLARMVLFVFRAKQPLQITLSLRRTSFRYASVYRSLEHLFLTQSIRSL